MEEIRSIGTYDAKSGVIILANKLNEVIREFENITRELDELNEYIESLKQQSN